MLSTDWITGVCSKVRQGSSTYGVFTLSYRLIKMTEDQLEKITEEYPDFIMLLEYFNLTPEEVFVILYESGNLDEELLEELCPL